jgi:hypothetical protein
MKKAYISFILSMSVLIIFKANCQEINLNPKKKLIDFGWNSPLIGDYIKNPKKFENSPFDGITLRLPKGVGAGNIFMVNDLRKLPADSMVIIKTLAPKTPKSTILTDNFIALFGASQMDWFSDEDWAVVEKNIRYAAQIAKLSNCKGIIWDPEAYKPGKNPWKYDELENPKKISYQDYYKQVRKRGGQFMKALQEEYPGLTVLSLREFSDFQNGSPYSEPMLPVRNVAETLNKLEKAWWALHLPFTVGILDTIDKNVNFIDANEEAYYYTSALEFYQARNIIKNDTRALLPKEIHHKFASNYTIGHAIALDYICGNWAPLISFPYRLKGQAKMLTAKQQALWFEHNAYYALRTSDEYAWLYTEPTNFWTGENVPEGFKEALFSAKKKVANNEPLGFDVEEMLKIARQKAEEFSPEKKK